MDRQWAQLIVFHKKNVFTELYKTIIENRRTVSPKLTLFIISFKYLIVLFIFYPLKKRGYYAVKINKTYYMKHCHSKSKI